MSSVDNVTIGQQSRALALSTVAFTTCFAVWTIFSIIGIQIQKDLGLSETESVCWLVRLSFPAR